MTEKNLLLQALRSFAVAMSGSYDVSDMSHELSERVTEALGAAGAGVSVADGQGKLKFVTATSQPIFEMEEIQEKDQDGPCVLAFMTQQPVAITDIRETDDWPAYAAVAGKLGLRSVVGFPLRYNDTRLGALNLYDREPRQWSDDDLDTLGVFADMATAYLVRISELAEARQLADQLQHALDSRLVIEQAKGILSGEHGISLDEAFERLRQHSRNNNIKLVEVCNGVVNMGLRIPKP